MCPMEGGEMRPESRHQETSRQEGECLRVHDEVASCYRNIVSLKKHPNSLSPADKLPPELLAQIFHLVMRSYDHHTKDAMSWVVVSHVCQHWRLVALQTASLWTVINPGFPEQTKLFLERSGQSPLTLVTTDTKQVDMDILGTALEEAHRFSCVDMAFHPSWDAFRQSFNWKILPLLETISFKPLQVDELGAEPGPMPLIFDQFQLPALRSLALSGYQLNYSSPMFAPTLTTLAITYSANVSVPAIIEMLSKTPLLSSFTIESDNTITTSEIILSPVAPARRINLVHLKFFSLAFLFDQIATLSLLNQLSFPSQATFNMETLLPDESTHLSTVHFYQGLSPTLLGENRIGPTPTYRTCSLDLSDMTADLWYELYPMQHDATADMDIVADSRKTSHGFFGRVPMDMAIPSVAVTNLLELAQRLPLGDIESIFVDDTWGPWWEDIETPDWHLVCSLMPKLSRMQVHAHDTLEVPYYQAFWSRLLLYSESEVIEASNSSRIPAHLHLKTLVISEIPFDSEFNWVSPLFDVLERRKSDGVAIERLVLEDCDGVPREDIERCREVVGDVILTSLQEK